MDLMLSSAFKKSWNEVLKKVKNSAVFVDTAMAESLHWRGGISLLFKHGVTTVKDFSCFESCRNDVRKAVFLLEDFPHMVSSIRSTLRDIISSSYFEYVVVVVADSPPHSTSANSGGSGESFEVRSALEILEEDILKWMRNMNFTVEIFFLPLLLPVCFSGVPGLFLLPSISDDTSEHVSSIAKNVAPGENTASVSKLSHVLTSMILSLGHNVRESIYSLGPNSKRIGKALAQNFQQRKSQAPASVPPHKVALILVDRSSDLPTALRLRHPPLGDLDAPPPSSCTPAPVIPLTHFLSSLPPFEGHTVDCAIPLHIGADHPVKESTRTLVQTSSVPPGCLSDILNTSDDGCASSDPPSSSADWSEFIWKPFSSKDAVVDAVTKKLKLKMKRASGEEDNQSMTLDDTLKQFWALLREEQASLEDWQRNLPLLEVAHAVSYSSLGQNLSSDEAGRAASFCRLEEWERTLLNLWQDTEDITAASSLLLKWLCEIPLRHHRDGELSDPENSPSKQKTLGPSLDELTMLLFLFFSLIPSPPTTQGDKSNRASEKDTLNVLEREKLESAFMRAFLLQKVNKEGLLTAFVPGSSSEVEFDLVCQKLFDMLNELSSHRVHLNDLSSNSEKWKLSIVPTASEECFLVSLVKLLVDSSRPEIAELERHAEEGFRDLIKSKFSLFVNVAKEKPGDAETVIIFVSEGLTPYEIVAVRELLAKSNAQETSRKNIILGGTNLLTVERTVRNLLNQCLG